MRFESVDIDGIIERQVDYWYSAEYQADCVRQLRVREVVVQDYVKQNYRRFELAEIEGPFPIGPDFRVKYRGEWVMAEVEVECGNYVKHEHHKDPRHRECQILIVLSPKPPSAKIARHVPRIVWHIDHEYFNEWLTAATACDPRLVEVWKRRDREQAKFDSLTGEMLRRIRQLGPDEDDPNCDYRADSLAFDFAVKHLAGSQEEIMLKRITAEELDAFCARALE